MMCSFRAREAVSCESFSLRPGRSLPRTLLTRNSWRQLYRSAERARSSLNRAYKSRVNAAMSTSPRFSFHAFLLACGLAMAFTAGAQQPPATVDTTRHVQRLAPQRITGTRLAPLDSASRGVGAHADLISRSDVRRVTPGPATAAQLLGGRTGARSPGAQGPRAQPAPALRGWPLPPVVGPPRGGCVFLDGVRTNEADAKEVNPHLTPTEAINRKSTRLNSSDLV